MHTDLPDHPSGTPPVAIVTGASRRRGIGAALVTHLAAAGARVLFTAWRPYDSASTWEADPDGPEFLVQTVGDTGGLAEWIEIDLRAEGASAVVFDTAESLFGPVNILVNNAAHSTHDRWNLLSPAELDNHWRVNARATALLSAEFARRWPGGNGGRIVNLTSGQGAGPMPGEIAYAMSKAAIEAFTVSFAVDAAKAGIRTNAVDPGPTDTGWMTASERETILERFPAGRIGTPEDVVRLVTFLCSRSGEWITGQILRSDGGFRRG